MNRIIATVALAGALSGGTLAVAPSAHAEDHRPCVSKIEYQSAGKGHVVARDALEDRWDVPRGLHMPQFDTRGTYVMAYKACGYNIVEAQVLVRYSLYTDKVDETQRWVSKSATIHGYP